MSAGIQVSYAVLRAPLEETIRRGTSRAQPVPEAIIRAMHPQFADLGPLEPHAIDAVELDVASLLEHLAQQLPKGRYLLRG